MPDANALEVREHVLAKMNELARDFPEDVVWEINFDTTQYTSESINEVFKSLRDAIILVAIVVLVFLQNWRSAIIPLLTVPVAIVGTFAAMVVFGFSLNNLTLFGLVLAIGIVVDDAIVVVEAVEHHIADRVVAARRDAAGHAAGFRAGDRRRAGTDGRVRALRVHQWHHGTVLPAVRADDLRIDDHLGVQLADAQPSAVLRWCCVRAAPKPLRRSLGLAGIGRRLVGLGVSASLCRGPGPLRRSAGCVAALDYVRSSRTCRSGRELADQSPAPLAFAIFNRAFDLFASVYLWTVGKLLYVAVLVLAIYGGLLAVTYDKFQNTPKGFIPQQDMGYLLVTVQLPDSASFERTARVMRQIEEFVMSIPGVHHVTAITGESFATSAAGSNFGSMFVGFDVYQLRRDPSRSSAAIVGQAERGVSKRSSDAQIQVFPPPPMRGVGPGRRIHADGRRPRRRPGPRPLQAQTEELVDLANKNPQLTNLFSVFRANVPMLKVEPDSAR